MTMGEVKAVTKDWKDEPPLVFLVEALVKGFSGEQPSEKPNSVPERSIVSDLDQRNERMLQDIEHQAPLDQLPIIHGRKDPGLDRFVPTFDEEVLRARNAQAQKRAEMWLKVAAMRKAN